MEAYWKTTWNIIIQQMLLAYNISGNINLLSRGLYVPLWVEIIWFVGSVLTVIAASVQIHLQISKCKSILRSSDFLEEAVKKLMM